MIERYLILALLHKLYVYYDALVLGAIGFLILSGLGSTFITARRRPLFQLLGAVYILLLLLGQDALSSWAILLLLAPVALVTGSFFPALFEAAANASSRPTPACQAGASRGPLHPELRQIKCSL